MDPGCTHGCLPPSLEPGRRGRSPGRARGSRSQRRPPQCHPVREEPGGHRFASELRAGSESWAVITIREASGSLRLISRELLLRRCPVVPLAEPCRGKRAVVSLDGGPARCCRQRMGRDAGQWVGRDAGQWVSRDAGQGVGRDAGQGMGRDAGMQAACPSVAGMLSRAHGDGAGLPSRQGLGELQVSGSMKGAQRNVGAGRSGQGPGLAPRGAARGIGAVHPPLVLQHLCALAVPAPVGGRRGAGAGTCTPRRYQGV